MQATRHQILWGYILVLSTVAALWFAAFWHFHQRIEQQHHHFEHIVEDQLKSVLNQFQQQFSVVYATQSLFQTYPETTQKELNTFTEGLLTAYPSIHGAGWVPYIQHEQRATFEARVQQQYPNFSIKEKSPEGPVVSSPYHEFYFPVRYVAPYQGRQNHRVIGFNLSSNPQRLDAIEKAWTSGEMRISAPLTLYQNKEPNGHILVMVPVYRSRKDSQSMESRMHSLTGMAVGVFHIRQSIEAALHSHLHMDIQMTFKDTTPSTEQHTLLYGKDFSFEPSEAPHFYLKENISMFGRLWEFQALGGESFQEWQLYGVSGVYFGIGLLLLLGGLSLHFSLKQAQPTKAIPRSSSAPQSSPVPVTLPQPQETVDALPPLPANLLSSLEPNQESIALEALSKEERQQIHILLVEDYSTNQSIAIQHLQSMDLSVTLAENGAEAVSLVKQQSYDLIIMDIEMPVMNGYEATRSIREWEFENPNAAHPQTPIVAVTGHAIESHREACFKYGMNDYISKPYYKENLLGIVTRWCPQFKKTQTMENS